MRYATIEDLPFVWQINLPIAAQHVFKDAFNRAWSRLRDDRQARMHAVAEVRRRFERDAHTGRWVAKRDVQARRRGAPVQARGGFSPRALTRRK